MLGGVNPEAQANNNLLNTFRVGELTNGGGEVSLPIQDGIVDFFGGLNKFNEGTAATPFLGQLTTNIGSGFNGQTVRTLVKPTGNASNIKITILGPNASGTQITIDAVAICERGGGANCTQTPEPILFSTTPFTLTTNQEIVSNDLSFSIDNTKEYLVIFDLNSGGQANDSVLSTSSTSAERINYRKSNATSTGIKDLTNINFTDSQTVLVKSIDNTDPPTPDSIITLLISAERDAESCHLLLFEEDGETVVLNQDLKAFCSNDGVTYTEVILGDDGKYLGSKRLLSGSVRLNTIGKNMSYKIEKTKDLNLEGVGFEWN
jgi:hypothetical protein